MSTNPIEIAPLTHSESGPPPPEERLPEERVLELIARTLNLSRDSISEASDMHNTRHWDSLRHVLLMIEIEQSYGLLLSDLEMAGATSVVEIRRMLRKRGHV